MIGRKVRIQKLTFTPRNPAVWGSVDTWTPGRSYQASISKLTAEMQVRAGRDSAQEGYRVWSKIQVSTGDRVKIDGKDYLVVYALGDSSGSRDSYCDVKAVENA
jgi:head-tail adaptor